MEWWADIEADFWRFYPAAVAQWGMRQIPWRLFMVMLRGLPADSAFATRVHEHHDKHDWRKQLDRATGRQPGEWRGEMTLHELAAEVQNAPIPIRR